MVVGTFYINRDMYTIFRTYYYRNSKWPSGNKILAVIKREGEGDYIWVSGYQPDNHTWSQGHYGFRTLMDAVDDLKSEYPGVKYVNIDRVYHLYSKTDSFGWYPEGESWKRAYYLAKRRGEVIYFDDRRATRFKAVWKKDVGKCFLKSTDGELYELFESGRTRDLYTFDF